jgi:hypothetical protein
MDTLDDSDRELNRKRGRTIRIFFPFLLLALIVIGMYLTRQSLGNKPANEITGTTPFPSSQTVEFEQHVPDGTSVLPTPWAAAATVTDPPSTSIPTSALPIDATIKLSGPPPGSTFYLHDPVSAYWNWPLRLSDDQQFAIYLIVDQTEHLAGVVREPNMGNHGYQFSFDPGVLSEKDGSYQLQVRLLEEKESSIVIAASTPRAFSLLLHPEP